MRRAAVTLVIERMPPHGVLFIERAAHLRHHAGEIGLPGGAAEASDASLEQTALRELHEELGVPPERTTIVATLTDVRPRVSGYVVTPFVAIADSGPYTLDRGEVAGFFTVPLYELLDQGVREGSVPVGAFNVHSYIFDYGSIRIWGMTARILEEFVRTFHAPESALRSSIERALETS